MRSGWKPKSRPLFGTPPNGSKQARKHGWNRSDWSVVVPGRPPRTSTSTRSPAPIRSSFIGSMLRKVLPSLASSSKVVPGRTIFSSRSPVAFQIRHRWS